MWVVLCEHLGTALGTEHLGPEVSSPETLRDEGILLGPLRSKT